MVANQYTLSYNLILHSSLMLLEQSTRVSYILTNQVLVSYKPVSYKKTCIVRMHSKCHNSYDLMTPFKLFLRPSLLGNAIVQFHLRSNFWKRQIGRSHGNGTVAYQFCFVFRRERNPSIDMFSICLFRRERNDCVVFHFSHYCLDVPFLERNGSL